MAALAEGLAVFGDEDGGARAWAADEAVGRIRRDRVDEGDGDVGGAADLVLLMEALGVLPPATGVTLDGRGAVFVDLDAEAADVLALKLEDVVGDRAADEGVPGDITFLALAEGDGLEVGAAVTGLLDDPLATREGDPAAEDG